MNTASTEFCSSVREIAISSRGFVQANSFGIVLVYFTLLNILYQCIRNRRVSKLKAYPHLSEAAREEVTARHVQALCGLWAAVSGYTVLIIQLATQCSAANDIFVFVGGGICIVMHDLHEYVRRWPLPLPLLTHHIGVFLVGLAYIEWDVLPAIPEGASERPPIHWSGVLLVSNIGVQYVAAFFGAAFRIGTSVQYIRKWWKAQLVVFAIRLVNVALMCVMLSNAAKSGSYIGVALLILLIFGYSHNSWEVFKFTINFDCEKYFTNHQLKWEATEEKETTNISSTAETCSDEEQPVSDSDLDVNATKETKDLEVQDDVLPSSSLPPAPEKEGLTEATSDEKETTNIPSTVELCSDEEKPVSDSDLNVGVIKEKEDLEVQDDVLPLSSLPPALDPEDLTLAEQHV